MIVEKIDNTESYSVRKSQYDITWYLVRDLGSAHPTVVSIGGRSRVDRHEYLSSNGPTAKRMVKAVRDHLSTEVKDAVEGWFKVSEQYSDFGASDTEPRAVFSEVFEAAARDRDVTLPRTVRDWQIFDAELMGRSGSGEAARALTAAAKRVVKAVRNNPEKGREVFKYYYGWAP